MSQTNTTALTATDQQPDKPPFHQVAQDLLNRQGRVFELFQLNVAVLHLDLVMVLCFLISNCKIPPPAHRPLAEALVAAAIRRQSEFGAIATALLALDRETACNAIQQSIVKMPNSFALKPVLDLAEAFQALTKSA